MPLPVAPLTRGGRDGGSCPIPAGAVTAGLRCSLLQARRGLALVLRGKDTRSAQGTTAFRWVEARAGTTPRVTFRAVDGLAYEVEIKTVHNRASIGGIAISQQSRSIAHFHRHLLGL